MIRVLHVLGGLGTGGTESLIMNWYRNIVSNKKNFLIHNIGMLPYIYIRNLVPFPAHDLVFI